MYVKIFNENYGYAVTTYGDYVVASNPSILPYNPSTPSVLRTGSVECFRYNKNTDTHDFIARLHIKETPLDAIIARESGTPNGLQTENPGIVPSTKDLPISIDKDRYTSSVDNGFGLAMDMYGKTLVVGSPYYKQYISTDAITITASGAMVSIFNLGLTEYLNYVPDTDIQVFSIEDPDSGISPTGSFGKAVSINQDWIAVGSPSVSGSKGMVYMFKNYSSGNTYSWTLYQKLTIPTADVNTQFGACLQLNKSSSSTSMVVGCGTQYDCKAYYFEYINGTWTNTFTFRPDYSTYPMPTVNYFPYEAGPYNVGTNGFGMAVATYGDTVVIGEPFDRLIHEFSGSTLYSQGSAYIFERCRPTSSFDPTLFEQVLKTYGNEYTLPSNHLGWAVDIFGNNIVVGIPKHDADSLTSCYIGGTLEQLHQCPPDLKHILNGQAMLIQKNTSSLDWEITNVYQRKKKYLSPYRSFGLDVATANRSMVVGAPILFADTNREINITTTSSNNIKLDDVTGKAYIYNYTNLHSNYHIGNVFYRNGKIVVMTSGSDFNGLFFDPVATNNYRYDIQFKGQHTIFEKQIICTVNPGEFNISTNPTAIIKPTASFDLNKNGRVDFQDIDIILRYMQYKNTSNLGVPVSTNWSSSIVTAEDEISLFAWYKNNTSFEGTDELYTSNFVKWETTDTWMQEVLDLNDDSKIDVRDMNIMWKYFANRLTPSNYASYITPECNRKLFSDVIDYMGGLTQRDVKPLINPEFLKYEQSVTLDKTGSYLAPMVTTVGLYSGLDLVSVAKLGSPIKITPELPINFVIKMDY